LRSVPPHPAPSAPTSPRWGEVNRVWCAILVRLHKPCHDDSPLPCGERSRAKRAGEGGPNRGKRDGRLPITSGEGARRNMRLASCACRHGIGRCCPRPSSRSGVPHISTSPACAGAQCTTSDSRGLRALHALPATAARVPAEPSVSSWGGSWMHYAGHRMHFPARSADWRSQRSAGAIY
jgi:hypothetical protein